MDLPVQIEPRGPRGRKSGPITSASSSVSATRFSGGRRAIHPQAVRRWIRVGLRTIDHSRPFLVHGSDLIDFLTLRQSSRKQRCGHNQFFCCRCRTPRGALDNRVNIQILNLKQLNISGRCERCGALMNRAGSVEKLDDYRKSFAVQTPAHRRLREVADGGVMCHLDKEKADAALQPQE